MTKKEAIEYGKKWDEALESRGDTPLSEARQFLNLAIKALEERPQGDLISREWLEDAFDNLCCHNCKICRNFRIEDSFYKCALIDNAPTVTPSLSLDNITEEDVEKFKMVWQRATGKGLLHVINEERPEGEWEDYSIDFWKCPECGYLLNKYCPQCYNKVIIPKGGKEE